MLSLLHSIIGAFGSMVGKIFGLGLCSSCRFSASLFGIMLHQFLPLQVTYFRALPHSLASLFQYIFLSLMILNIMHHVHDCNRVLEVRRGLVASIVLFPPTSLKDRVVKALELCSCGKEKIFGVLIFFNEFSKIQLIANFYKLPILYFAEKKKRKKKINSCEATNNVQR